MQSLSMLLVTIFAVIAVFSTTGVIAQSLSDFDTLWQAIQKPEHCPAAQELLGYLKSIVAFNETTALSTVTSMCQLQTGIDPDVCKGGIAEEGHILAQQVGKMSINSTTSYWLAVALLGQCGYPETKSYTVSFPKPKPAVSRPVPSGKGPIQIVHYSDIHIDPLYIEGANYNCSKGITCCRDYGPADAPGNNSFPAGPYGEPTCDSPLSLEQSMYEAINRTVPNANFVLFTGDIVDHAVWNTTQDKNTVAINEAYERMTSFFNLIYGTVGNHESSPANAFQTTNENSGSFWVYDLLSSAWSNWIKDAAASQVKSTGYYSSTYPEGKLRVISLNTNLYYIQNYWMYEQEMESDPDGQFAWLVNQLQDAEDAGDRVYIMGHMPMGSSDTFHDYSYHFDQIVNRYENTIAALFFGHMHADELEIAYSSYPGQDFSTASAISYICPSMEPGVGHPAFRVYSVDPDNYAILDSITYYADMSDPEYQTSGPAWKKLYSAKEAYGPMVSPPPGPSDELSPAFWHNVTVAFKNDQTNLDQYIKYKTRGYNVKPLTADQASNEICQIRAMRAQDNCYKPQPGLNLMKRDSTDDQPDDDSPGGDEPSNDDPSSNDSSNDDPGSDDSGNDSTDAEENGDPVDPDECGMSVVKMTFGAMIKHRPCFDIFTAAVSRALQNNATSPSNGASPTNSTSAGNASDGSDNPETGTGSSAGNFTGADDGSDASNSTTTGNGSDSGNDANGGDGSNNGTDSDTGNDSGSSSNSDTGDESGTSGDTDTGSSTGTNDGSETDDNAGTSAEPTDGDDAEAAGDD